MDICSLFVSGGYEDYSDALACICPSFLTKVLPTKPLEDVLPHSLYKGTYKEYGWWWHYMLDTAPGWWNNNGYQHVYFKTVVAFTLCC